MEQPSQQGVRGSPRPSTNAERLPPLTGWLRAGVDAVARIRASIHHKLLFGFLTGALLLVGMAVLSLLVIDRMDSRVSDLNRHAVKVDQAQDLLYDVTSQSHYRAMALLLHDTRPEEAADYNDNVQERKEHFANLLARMQREAPGEAATYREIEAASTRYDQFGERVLARYDAGDIPGAIRLHLQLEHPRSHVLEDDLLNPLIERSTAQMANARAAFAADRSLLTWNVLGFSAISVVFALLLGFLLSWAFILPVRRIQGALAAVTAGDFDQRVDVANRDELGRLSSDVNRTSARIGELFRNQRRLTDRLAETNASLEHASEAKSRFLASVSHELRTPMNAILGFTDALLAGVDGPLNEEQKTSLGWVQRGGRDLLGLINEILDLSKIEAGKLNLEPQPFNPRELIEAVVAQHRSLAAQKRIRLTTPESDLPDRVILDPQRFRQILVNLIGNALKFTEQGEVMVEAGTAADGSLQVAVRDTGPGIPADKMELIFDEFRQEEKHAGGTGLGLAISRHLAHAMGGDIGVESTLGAGSVFRLNLPQDCRVAPANELGDPRSPVDGARRLLLSVDDDPSVAPLLQKMLADSGYRVIASASAKAAPADARRLRPAAILLDLLMPDHTGEDVLSELKSAPDTRDIPVIVVSVVDQTEVPELADGYVGKPLDRARLLTSLEGTVSDGSGR